MRPQRDAADNAGDDEALVLRGHASMRPQRDAADNLALHDRVGQGVRASMRPQRDAADNSRITEWAADIAECFNEAAA